MCRYFVLDTDFDDARGARYVPVVADADPGSNDWSALEIVWLVRLSRVLHALRLKALIRQWRRYRRKKGKWGLHSFQSRVTSRGVELSWAKLLPPKATTAAGGADATTVFGPLLLGVDEDAPRAPCPPPVSPATWTIQCSVQKKNSSREMHREPS